MASEASHLHKSPVTTEKSKDCPVCKGFGDIWVNWSQWPLTCGQCHGTGRQS